MLYSVSYTPVIILSTQPADHPTDHLREVLPGHKTPLEVLVSISVIMRNYTNECELSVILQCLFINCVFKV